YALPQLDFAGEDRDRAVGVDAEPRVEHAVVVEAAGQRGGLRLAERIGGERKRDDQRAAGLQEIAARERGLHAISFAARCTARTMRLCEAQRHRWSFNASLISRSLGRGLPSSSALEAPHWARPQPNFGPFSSRSLRRTYRSGVSGATADTFRVAPFTRNVKSAILSSGQGLCAWAGNESVHHRGGGEPAQARRRVGAPAAAPHAAPGGGVVRSYFG